MTATKSWESKRAIGLKALNDLSQRRLARHRTRGGETPERYFLA